MIEILQLIDLHFSKQGIDEDGISLICVTILSFNADNIGNYFNKCW